MEKFFLQGLRAERETEEKMRKALTEFNEWMEDSSGYYSLYMDWSPTMLFWAIIAGGMLLFINHFTGENEIVMAAVGCVWAIFVFGTAAFIALLATEFLLWHFLARQPRKGKGEEK